MEKRIISIVVFFLLIAAPVRAETPSETVVAPRLTENAGADGLTGRLANRLKFNGLVEVETFVGKNFLGEKTSDLSLAKVELGLEAKITDWITARMVVLYEESAENDHFIIDEGTIALGNEEKTPFYLTAGKMYVPFGSFKSAMVSDPLTLELAETSAISLLAGYTEGGWYGSLYVFNGKVNEAGGDNIMDTFGANLGYKLEKEDWQINLGAGWLNNLGNSNTMRDYIATTSSTVDGFTKALALHGRLQYSGWSVMTEYIAALASFQPGEMDFAGGGARPKAWQLELAYTTEVAEREVTLALGYQGTDEAVALGLPKHRYLASVGIDVLDKTTLALEYRQDKDYGLAQGGTNENEHQALMQLAVKF